MDGAFQVLRFSNERVEAADAWKPALVAILIATLFIYFAARLVLNRSSLLAALASAVVSTLLASLLLIYVGGILGLVLAIVVWGLFTAIFFGTGWARGAIIGLVAWVLWVLTLLALDALAK
ncbi:MAG TPA: hypothetical protein VI796_03690 [Candidatus Thermoplasmatota archaeon]|nr:hypothetical protein [Candidatus Thermoplasmatota archaeon]